MTTPHTHKGETMSDLTTPPMPPNDPTPPKKHKKIPAAYLYLAGSVILAAAVTITGITIANGTDSNEPEPTVTVTAATETPEETPTDYGPTSFALTDTATYETDVEVSLADFTRGVSSEWSSPENTPYIRFNVEITNGSEETMDLGEMVVTCQYGDTGHEGEEIFDSAKGLDGAPSTHLRPGRSITAPIACELPKGESYVQVEVVPDWESETAIFAGEVK